MQWKTALVVGGILCGIVIKILIILWWVRSGNTNDIIEIFTEASGVTGASIDQVNTDLNGNFITLDHIELSEKNKEQHASNKCTDLIKNLKLVDACRNVPRSDPCGAYYQRHTDGYASCDTAMVDSVKTCEPRKIFCK